MWYNELANISLIGAPINKKMAKLKNYLEFSNEFAHCLTFAKHRYGLKEGTCPDSISERVLIDSLLWYAGATFFDKKDTLLALPSRPTNDFNVYGDFGNAWVWGRNGYNEKIKLSIPGATPDDAVLLQGMNEKLSVDTKGVFVRENENMYPFINYVYDYAIKLSDTLRTLDVKRFQTKRPYIVTAQETVIPTVRKFFKDVNDNEEFIVGTGIFDANAVNVVPLNTSPADLKGVVELYDWYFGKFLELCGIINNQATAKKERLIVDEVNSNNEATEFSVNTVVDYLNKQMEQVNRIFGTNMEWEVKSYGMDESGRRDEQEVSRDSGTISD